MSQTQWPQCQGGLALAGGAGLGRAVGLAWRVGPPGRPARLMTVGLAALLAAIPPAALPVAFSERALNVEDEDADLNVFDRDAAASLRALAGPSDFVLTDHPYLAALAGRLVPPNLVDPSRGRTRAGVLTDVRVLEGPEVDVPRIVRTEVGAGSAAVLAGRADERSVGDASRQAQDSGHQAASQAVPDLHRHSFARVLRNACSYA